MAATRERLLPTRSSALPPELVGWADRLAEGERWSPPVRSHVQFQRPVAHGTARRFTVVLWGKSIPVLFADLTLHLPTAADVYDVLHALPMTLEVRAPYWIHRQVLRSDLMATDEDGHTWVCGHLYARATFPTGH